MPTITQQKPLQSPVADAATHEIIAPVLYDFAWWVLQQARARGIQRLYFLARDGYMMKLCAEQIARREGISIELRYLYCSRLSLRAASLGLLGEQAYDYLFEGGFSLTPRVILSRLRLNAEQRKQVLADIGYAFDENRQLGKAEKNEFCALLRESAEYNKFLRQNTRENHEITVAYLRQEQFLEDGGAVVDSGWTGSVQRMLTLLSGKPQIGFYFGMYTAPPAEYGEFNTYLFDRKTSPLLVSRFNNHLFESLCSAPHGMTVGYAEQDGEISPVFATEKSLNADNPLLERQQELLVRYIDFFEKSPPKSLKQRQSFAFPLLNRLMYSPTAEQAKIYGALLFSDDPGEQCVFPLAPALHGKERRVLGFMFRVKNKLFGTTARPVYWGAGSAVLSGKNKLGVRAWEILWLLKK